jgi:hypothetical protein
MLEQPQQFLLVEFDYAYRCQQKLFGFLHLAVTNKII